MKDNLDNLLKTLITPERVAQHELMDRILITNLHKKNDPLHNVLHQEIDEFRHSNRKAAENLEKCEMQMVALRGVINQLNDDIKRKESALYIDEVQCCELRNTTKLKKIEPSKTQNPMQGDAVKLLGKNNQPV